jgi:phosphonate transport system permease protein
MFEITPQRIWNGLTGLMVIVRLMMPPSPGELWMDILRGIGESVAMAFLGTFIWRRSSRCRWASWARATW